MPNKLERGLSHVAIVNKLRDLIEQSSSGEPLVGFGRVLECLEQLSEQSSNATIKAIRPKLTEALDVLFPSDPHDTAFVMVPYGDTRTNAQLQADEDRSWGLDR